jgi:hypothetical protein
MRKHAVREGDNYLATGRIRYSEFALGSVH